MIHFDLPKEQSSIIKVIGIGGGGGNAVNYMYSQSISGVNFIICNTDAQALAQSHVPNKVQLGPHLTQGLGAGANPEIGRQATEESLEEIRRILEVNTKMAFITAGMGGGTGTGGAPIISKICKDLGILTVGIVTTPFSYEGKKRKQQAEEGIRSLKQYVDTLLIISNDKLRHQFGNLKMKEAFSKADNVLATAAKCITDVINSTGQINVDFADVCTVMRDGGVAMLGSARAAGVDRAQKAIEEALNSPLLNDSDIRGAKWILLNINSAEGEHEFTMDEVEIIQQYLLERTGENTDVILGMGYDAHLGEDIGITLIATGYDYKDPFSATANSATERKKEDGKVLMMLDLGGGKEDKEQTKSAVEAVAQQQPVMEATLPCKQELAPRLVDAATEQEAGNKSSGANQVDKMGEEAETEWVISLPLISGNLSQNEPSVSQDPSNGKQTNSPVSAATGGYLAKPANIYAETNPSESNQEHQPVKEPISGTGASKNREEEPSSGNEMQLVFKDDIPAADEPRAPQPSAVTDFSVEDPAMQDEAGEQKRRAQERIQKLRNLSFNVNATDPNNEFDTVPAYIRRNLDLYNTFSSVENFYSNYEIRKDDEQDARLSTLNAFLDGKKPD
ncbi:MAG: cell division protein FtsZ [Bacteroidota bacterium]